MELFHCFPRPRDSTAGLVAAGATPKQSVSTIAQLILESILKFGLLCTPERLHIYPDQETTNERQKIRLWNGPLEYSHAQSRFCATLCTAEELFKAKIRGVVPGPEGPVIGGDNWLSHADLFGPYAVSFDPVLSRRLGIVPTVYYSPS